MASRRFASGCLRETATTFDVLSILVNRGALVDVLRAPNEQSGRVLTGTVHHIAWRTADDEQLLRWRRELTRLGHHVSVVRDRKYFNSIYYREPGGILFEIATDSPGFTVEMAGATGLEPAISYVTGRRSFPPNCGLAGRSGDRQLCYNRGTVDFLGSRGYAMSVLRSQPIAGQEKEARAWRERFVQNAVANVRLEGLEPSPKALEIWQSYIEGEVSVEQAGELIRALPTGV